MDVASNWIIYSVVSKQNNRKNRWKTERHAIISETKIVVSIIIWNIKIILWVINIIDINYSTVYCLNLIERSLLYVSDELLVQEGIVLKEWCHG